MPSLHPLLLILYSSPAFYRGDSLFYSPHGDSGVQDKKWIRRTGTHTFSVSRLKQSQTLPSMPARWEGRQCSSPLATCGSLGRSWRKASESTDLCPHLPRDSSSRPVFIRFHSPPPAQVQVLLENKEGPQQKCEHMTLCCERSDFDFHGGVNKGKKTFGEVGR